jgi:hypothetical protein
LFKKQGHQDGCIRRHHRGTNARRVVHRTPSLAGRRHRGQSQWYAPPPLAEYSPRLFPQLEFARTPKTVCPDRALRVRRRGREARASPMQGSVRGRNDAEGHEPARTGIRTVVPDGAVDIGHTPSSAEAHGAPSEGAAAKAA